MDPFPACCITVAEHIDPDAFVRRMAATVAPAGEIAVTAAFGRSEQRHLVVVDALGGWVVGVEPYGDQGSRPEVLRAVSVAGRAVSVCWTADSRVTIGYAADGQVLAGHDPNSGARRGPHPDALDPYTDGLSFADDERAAAVLLTERVTGVRLDQAWLTAPRPAFVITPLPQDLVPDGYQDHPAVADDELRALLARPAPDTLPRIATLAAELIARHAGIDAEPAVADALSALRNGRARAGLRERLTDLAEEYRRRRSAAAAAPGDGPQRASRIHHQRNAIRAVEAALDPDPAKAAWNACWIGGNAVGGDFGDQLRLTVLTRLADRAAGRR